MAANLKSGICFSMFGLGFSEIIFISLLALIVIGPKELPEVARTIGRFLNELRRSTDVLREDLKSQVKVEPTILVKPSSEPLSQELTAKLSETPDEHKS